MRLNFWWAAASLTVITGCQNPDSATEVVETTYPSRAEAPVFRSLIFGDWGRMGIEPQQQTAEYMAALV